MEFSELTGFPRILRRMDSDRRALRTRTLAKAAEIVGGTEALRRRFNVSALVLGVWLCGTRPELLKALEGGKALRAASLVLRFAQ
jgi:hypothetical protein